MTTSKIYLKNLCPYLKRDGDGICHLRECSHFHPIQQCNRGTECNRRTCSFLHPKEYYRPDSNNYFQLNLRNLKNECIDIDFFNDYMRKINN